MSLKTELLCVVFAALATLALPSSGQTGGAQKLSIGTSSCSLTGSTFDPATNTVTIACSTIDTTPCTSTASGSFSFSQTSSNAASGIIDTLLVTRSNAMDCTYTLTYTVTASAGTTVTVNGNASPTGTIVFQNQDSVPKSLAVVATSTANSTVSITLSGTVPGGITPFPTHVIQVAGSNPVILGCEAFTQPTYTDRFIVSNQKVEFRLKPGETGAVEFTPTAAAGPISLSTTETINTPPDADHEVTITTCPNDFSASVSPICRYTANYVGSTRIANTGTQVPRAVFHCPVNAGTRYFMNVRHRKLLDNTLNSCNGPGYMNGACEVRLQNQNFQ